MSGGLIFRLSKLFSCIIAACLLSFVALSTNVRAQPVSSCDPQFMQAMEARAWLETDREIVQNQNLMTRADSVLEYSCFDQLVSLAGEFPADIFSDNEGRWLLSTGGLPHIDNVSTDVALQEVVGIALFVYLFTNFGHTYLGDRTEILGAAPARAPRTYTCEALNYVWEKAKCMDLGEFRDSQNRNDLDMFYDFFWYVTNDPRDLPEDNPACTPLSGVWNTAITTAFNDQAPGRQSNRYILPETEEVMFAVDPYDIEDVIPTGAPLDRYIRFVVGVDHDLFSSCHTIETGMTVARTAGSSGPSANYDDVTCPNPQCFIDGGQCTQ